MITAAVAACAEGECGREWNPSLHAADGISPGGGQPWRAPISPDISVVHRRALRKFCTRNLARSLPRRRTDMFTLLAWVSNHVVDIGRRARRHRANDGGGPDPRWGIGGGV